jgi:hypothetical protein
VPFSQTGPLVAPVHEMETVRTTFQPSGPKRRTQSA